MKMNVANLSCGVGSKRSHRRQSHLFLLVVIILCLKTINAFQSSLSLHHNVLSRSSSIQIHYNNAVSSSPMSSSTTRLYGFFNNDEIEGPDRIKSCIPYLLPLLDGDMFGKYIYQRVPPLKVLDELFLSPLVTIFQSFPFLGLVFFLLLTIGTRNASGMNRVVKFNAQQAVLIDLALIFPTLIAEGLDGVGVPRIYEEMGNNFVYYFLISTILYSVVMNLRGTKPSGIPIISDAAELMTGPF